MKKITFNVDPEDFVLRHIFECGQCFRWDPVNENNMAEEEPLRCEMNGALSPGSENAYIGIASGRVARVSLDVSGDASKDVSNDISCDTGSNASGKEATLLIEQLNTPEGSDDESDISFWNNYFDLDTDYGEIKQVLSKDETIRRAIPFGHGIRILRQDPWETTVSFIISQNNNIPRIKRNIRDLSQLAGERVVIDNRTIGHATGSADQVNKDNLKGIAEDDWYEIPSPEVLAQMTVEDLAPVRLGYRARYLIETAQCVCERGLSVLYDDLDSLCGVGPKVASCIRLFGLDQISSFPIDVWVKRVMKELYGIEKPSEMAAFAEKTFGEYGGIAQQYLFYYMRENK